MVKHNLFDQLRNRDEDKLLSDYKAGLQGHHASGKAVSVEGDKRARRPGTSLPFPSDTPRHFSGKVVSVDGDKRGRSTDTGVSGPRRSSGRVVTVEGNRQGRRRDTGVPSVGEPTVRPRGDEQTRSQATTSTPSRGDKPHKPRNDKGTLRLTDRDILMLTFAAKYRVITVPLMAKLTRSPETSIKNRLNKLHNHGYLGKEPVRHGVVYHSVTKTGDTLGVSVSAHKPKLSGISHDVLVTSTAVDLGLGGGALDFLNLTDRTFLSERQIRSAHKQKVRAVSEGSYDPEPFDFKNPSVSAAHACPESYTGNAHYPDLVTVRRGDDDRPVFTALEIELSVKKVDEYEQIFLTYEGEICFKRVIYLTDQEYVRKRIEKAQERTGGRKIEVHVIDMEVLGGKVMG